ncbi:conserved hypothetical protein [Ferroglobus placidus DSM 10642]|uniref:Outer membrane lipoprotein carrier protein LolA n=1 Tax=Ferroglobus placidus (strain DSM 10642 / AEDII12DO) TaxID=589924 RepID=D3S2I0_FERPA|nr:outer membrane lipoprotein-sorting protein [Ferroglobus placidus]ADC64510.1 conserved hypothetical protein [Ferroglobus placidus DSM 10642]
MRKIFVILATLVFVSACTQMSAEEIAKKLEEKYDSVNDFKGKISYTMIGESGNITMEYEYVFKKPNKIWMRNEKAGTLIVSNGEKMWIYDEKKNEVFVMNVSKMPVNPDYGKLVKEMLEMYEVKLLGVERVAERECYVIELKSKEMNQSAKMWVDKEFWYPLRIESESYGIKIITEYKNVEFNTGVSDELFEFKIPEGAKVKTEEDFGIRKFESVEEAEKHVNFTLFKPEYTAGYELKEVKVIGEMISIVYEKEGRILTITESPGDELPKLSNSEKVKIGDEEGVYAEIFGNGMLAFKKDGVMISISGQLEKEELIKIAESMKP